MEQGELWVPLLILLALFAISTACLAIALWQFARWRRRADTDSSWLVPDALFDRLDASDARLHQLERAFMGLSNAQGEFRLVLKQFGEYIQKAGNQQLQEVGRHLQDANEHIGSIRNLAEERSRELDRHKEGYDHVVTRSMALGIIRTLDRIQDYRGQLEAQNEESSILDESIARLDATHDQLQMLLESNQIESFEPEIGTAAKEISRRIFPFESTPAASEKETGRIYSVRYPGYALRLGETQERVIREAQVGVYRSPSEELEHE